MYLYKADQLQNKLDELHVQCVTLDADFIFVTEVLPKYNPDNISCASMIYHIDGYKAFHSSDNGRGVIIYNISPNQYLNSLYHDATWCDWTVDHKTIILGCIYRSPSDIQSCESINRGPRGRLAITCTYFVCAKCSYPKKIKALLTY